MYNNINYSLSHPSWFSYTYNYHFIVFICCVECFKLPEHRKDGQMDSFTFILVDAAAGVSSVKVSQINFYYLFHTSFLSHHYYSRLHN